MIDVKLEVIRRLPGAFAVEDRDIGAYHRWTIRPARDSAFSHGGGPTEAEAWRNAWVHIDTEERWRANLARLGALAS